MSKPNGYCTDHCIDFYDYCPLCLRESELKKSSNKPEQPEEQDIPEGFLKWLEEERNKFDSYSITFDPWIEGAMAAYHHLSQKKEPVLPRWVKLGTKAFNYDENIFVRRTDNGAKAAVYVDGVRLLDGMGSVWGYTTDPEIEYLEESLPADNTSEPLTDKPVKYFFTQDDSCHWYMIPVEKRARWNELNNGDPDDDDNNDAINGEFGDYRTGGGIGDIEFYLTNNVTK